MQYTIGKYSFFFVLTAIILLSGCSIQHRIKRADK